jgi:hypothetical protein
MTTTTTSGTILVHLAKEPRAVALVLGHLGATSSALERYAYWYIQRGCSTLAAASPPGRFAANLSLRSTAVNMLRETAEALKQAETTANRRVPVIIHSMSNGGCFLLEQIEVILEQSNNTQGHAGSITAEADPSSVSPEEHLDSETLSRIADRLAIGGQLFDSCPCVIRTFWWQGSPAWNESFPHPEWSSTVRWRYTASATTALSLWCACTFAWQRPRQFWTRMSSSRACRHQTYLYSTRDTASDAKAVDHLIETRKRGIPDLNVRVYQWNDSGHCRLHKDHPDEYQQAIDEALEGAVVRGQTK